jgi:hypothetical protein
VGSDAPYETFEKRDRHKTRGDRYEPKERKQNSEKKGGGTKPKKKKQKKGAGKRTAKRAGEDIIQNFSSKSVSQDRLTASISSFS